MEDFQGNKSKCPKKGFISRISTDSDSGSPASQFEFPQNQSFTEMARNAVAMRHSLSQISLPDDLRISFSEIEDSSVQLDDIDLGCSSSVDVDLTAGNLTNVGELKEEEDPELQNINTATSTCGPQYQRLSSMERLPLVTGRSSGSVSTFGSEEGEENMGDNYTMMEDTPSIKSDQSSSSLPDFMYNNSGETAWKTTAKAQQVSTVGSSGQEMKKKGISPRRSSKNKHMENIACQVCGDMAAGFYCGAYICEACKKFYMRAYKQDKLKYVCLRDKKCVITKESRVQCQYCRFQKCVDLNMYCPKQGETDSNKDMQMSEIPCRVCSAPSSGFHFGAITCEGCKGFFRRMAKEREAEKYQCNKKGECEINMITRNICKACRYKACVRAGMSVEGSRIGRQPNSVKHAISMELKHTGGKGDNFENPFTGESGFLKVKDEPLDCNDDFLKEKSNDTSFWDSWASTNYSLPSTGSQQPSGSMSDNQFLTSVASTMYTSSSSKPTDTASTPGLGSDIRPPTILSSQQSPSTLQATDPWSQQQHAGNLHSPVMQSERAPGPVRTERLHSSVVPEKPYPTVPNMARQMSNERQQQAIPDLNRQHSVPPEMNRQHSVPGSGVPPSSMATSHAPVQPVHNIPATANSDNLAPITETTNLSKMSLNEQQQQQQQQLPMLKILPSLQALANKPNCNNKNMEEFISKIIDAGKCLQLLNYRVFDTDVNPTTAMNVEDIKTLFKNNYMDPKEGNIITSKVDMSIFTTRESTWNYMMTNFHHNTYITIRFAKLVPGFKTLTLNDQVKLIQSSIYPIELLNMSEVYDQGTKKYNFFTYTKAEENVILEKFPMLRVFQEHFLHVGEMVKSFHFTDVEFAILSALLLFPAEIQGLENPKAVEMLQTEMSQALQYYEEQTFPDGLTRYGILLVRVAELVQCLLQHNLAIGLLLAHNPTIKVPQLFHELIIESIKEGQNTK